MPNGKIQALKKTSSEQSKKDEAMSDSKTEEAANYDIVVLKNMDPTTEIADIKYSLQELGYQVMSVNNLKNQLTGVALPIFFVKLYKNPLNHSVYGYKKVAHQVVRIEEYMTTPDLPRCTRCQSLEHLKDTCKNPPVCSWCSEAHFTNTCPTSYKTPPKCSRCSGSHPSNYKGCKVYKKYMEEKFNKSPPVISSPNIPSLSDSSSSSTTVNTAISNDKALDTSSNNSPSSKGTTPTSCLSEGELPIVESAETKSEKEIYRMNWSPPKCQLASPESICKQLEDNLKNYFSMNKELREKLFKNDPDKENLD